MTDQNQFQIEPFKPGWGVRSGHAQTIIGRFARNRYGIVFHRRRVQTPDGDFIDIDFPEIAGHLLDESAPLVLLLHGLEGNARRPYACETYYYLAQMGIRSVGMNYRSCSGEMNKKPYSYHAGATEDVQFVYDLLEKWYPHTEKGMIGFSLGANLLLKYLGELGENVPNSLKTAVAISPPFDLAKGSAEMIRGLNKIYNRIFMRAIRRKLVAKQEIIQDVLDIEPILNTTYIAELDELYIAPVNGYESASEYYAHVSSGQYLEKITIPTLIMRSLDDPLFDREDVPYEVLENNPNLQSYISERGGHLGYIEGRPGNYSQWSERQGARFLHQYLGNSSTLKH